MNRRNLRSRPKLIFLLALVWTFHFSFGMLFHYHPDYAHAHSGELDSHRHGGHFHSLQMDQLAELLFHENLPLRHGETHHHSESLPGNAAETVQYDFNQSSIPEFKPDAVYHSGPAQVSATPPQPELYRSSTAFSVLRGNLLLPHPLSERAPPLRL
ncbi:MAG: hypothetical protein GWM98_19165 [Nitrospinaceae bacterium]|nr:hypothetical protein [Nitrospinaceae bacterium]NIR56213.1 hypothetical protein [Nitrospinaceae bacterium]NIS86669.1 hypothetical protein [Nitrospinaceae bacterium]NIT83502.1 hypothetical protein [Nitrospinaceae bacterium]NIU45707.1 hypothetical protein [Nitrospinaceae bacterium]